MFPCWQLEHYPKWIFLGFIGSLADKLLNFLSIRIHHKNTKILLHHENTIDDAFARYCGGAVAAPEIPTNQNGHSSPTSRDTRMAGATAAPTDQNSRRWSLSLQDMAARSTVAWSTVQFLKRMVRPSAAPKTLYDTTLTALKLSGTPSSRGQIVRPRTTLEKSHDKTAETAKSMDLPQHRTPPLRKLAGQTKSAWAIPPNPYKTPRCANQPHRAGVHSPVQALATGVDNEVLRPPPPPAPDKEVSENLLVLLLHNNSQLDQEELEMMVATRNLKLRTMPLPEARQMVDIGKKGCFRYYVSPEFLTAMDNQSTEVSMGGEPQP
jgi:hypothetical protein